VRRRDLHADVRTGELRARRLRRIVFVLERGGV
jgi:hypothetical protein